jgi:hypothetical protein
MYPKRKLSCGKHGKMKTGRSTQHLKQKDTKANEIQNSHGNNNNKHLLSVYNVCYA